MEHKYISIEEMFDQIHEMLDKTLLMNHSNTIKSLCPFHSEKTPSFFVSLKKESFYCFGCQQKGSLISLHKKFYPDRYKKKIFENEISYQTAILDKEEKYLKIMSYIEDISKKNLILPSNKAFIDFIESRDLKLNDALLFNIGAALNIKDYLVNHYKIKLKDLEETPGFKIINNKVVFELEGCLVFPIKNNKKQTVGFSGRKITEKKYYSMSNNEFFKKGDHLFLVNYIPSEPLYIVEGFFDVISLAKKNKFAAAVMGSNLTAKQIELINSMNNKGIIFAADSDKSGILCNIKMSNMLKCENEKIAVNFEFKDIDECIRNKKEFTLLGRKDYINIVRNIYPEDNDIFLNLNYEEKKEIFDSYINEQKFEKAKYLLDNFEDDEIFFLMKKLLDIEIKFFKNEYKNENFFFNKEFLRYIINDSNYENNNKNINFKYNQILIQYYANKIQLSILDNKLPLCIDKFFEQKKITIDCLKILNEIENEE